MGERLVWYVEGKPVSPNYTPGAKLMRVIMYRPSMQTLKHNDIIMRYLSDIPKAWNGELLNEMHYLLKPSKQQPQNEMHQDSEGVWYKLGSCEPKVNTSGAYLTTTLDVVHISHYTSTYRYTAEDGDTYDMSVYNDSDANFLLGKLIRLTDKELISMKINNKHQSKHDLTICQRYWLSVYLQKIEIIALTGCAAIVLLIGLHLAGYLSIFTSAILIVSMLLASLLLCIIAPEDDIMYDLIVSLGNRNADVVCPLDTEE